MKQQAPCMYSESTRTSKSPMQMSTMIRAATSIGRIKCAGDDCPDDDGGKRSQCLYDTSPCPSITVSYNTKGEPEYVIYPFLYTPSRVLMCMSSRKTTGQYQFGKGNIDEMADDLANVSGFWTQSGKRHTLSKGEYKAAQAEGSAHCTRDCLGGKKPSVGVGAVTGGLSQETGGM